ncbi:sugar phosphate isomerase/epimerase family protein [Flavicella sediminum]|uniref:sugar phosphate isomerase/epimerase family protein n=1 Tax=Flavicella sediminum TaxID=2585141 RepID=UPI0011215D21|nr:TIM barrel protein [Flavicella sediminum]
MKIKFFCPYWGSEHLGYNLFLNKIKKAGYDGVEIILPYDASEKKIIKTIAKDLGLEIIALWGGVIDGDFETSLLTYERHLRNACSIDPLFVNIQTGKDYYSYEQNMQFLNLAAKISKETNTKIIHETHRGKFSFTAQTTSIYLENNPWIKITADFSHWCNVSESLLEDQLENLVLPIERSEHIHARVGFSEGPQIPDPRDPEWKEALDIHMNWWDQIIDLRRKEGHDYMSISPEFGPFPYMTKLPYCGLPITSQWEVNLFMKDLLKKRYS